MSRSDAVAALAANASPTCAARSTVWRDGRLLPASSRRAAARADVQAIERDIAELFRHLGVDDLTIPPPPHQ